MLCDSGAVTHPPSWMSFIKEHNLGLYANGKQKVSKTFYLGSNPSDPVDIGKHRNFIII